MDKYTQWIKAAIILTAGLSAYFLGQEARVVICIIILTGCTIEVLREENRALTLFGIILLCLTALERWQQ